jgi:DNA-binding NarL/FixJ family response regulator
MTSRKIKVMLVEDHVIVREGLSDLIQRQDDMEVIGEAADGRAAVRLVGKLKPDVVLMDIALPGMSGIEATRSIKRSNPKTIVLVLTAYDNEEFVIAILKAGAAGYLLKNVRGRQLVNSIRSVYEGESVFDPAVVGKVVSGYRSDRATGGQRSAIALSNRELQVVELGATGLVNKEIADRLSLGERTIQTHWRNMFNKLGVSSRIEVIMHCLRKGWIDAETERNAGS